MIRVIKMFKVIVILLTIWGFGLVQREALPTAHRLTPQTSPLRPRPSHALQLEVRYAAPPRLMSKPNYITKVKP